MLLSLHIFPIVYSSWLPTSRQGGIGGTGGVWYKLRKIPAIKGRVIGPGVRVGIRRLGYKQQVRLLSLPTNASQWFKRSVGVFHTPPFVEI